MKIISLNSFAGRVYEPLMEFIERHGPTTDIFCLQEILSANAPNLPKTSPHDARTHLLQEIQTILPNHSFMFDATQVGFDLYEKTDLNIDFGIATFWKKDLELASRDSFLIYGKKNGLIDRDWSTLASNAIITTFALPEGPLTVCNLHGTSQPGNKLDTPDRIKQSQVIMDKLKDIDGPKIVMGDFNLFPETESIKMFEHAGLRNLIKDYNIKTTRGSKMRELFPEYEHGKYGFQEFADYTFVTPDINIDSFEVPDEPISDHLPMVLEFTI